jgi:hypothetical protein
MRRAGSSGRRVIDFPLALNARFNAALTAMAAEEANRTYLVVIDDSAEARVALRFAARRALKTGGSVEFSPWSNRRISFNGAAFRRQWKKNKGYASKAW